MLGRVIVYSVAVEVCKRPQGACCMSSWLVLRKKAMDLGHRAWARDNPAPFPLRDL